MIFYPTLLREAPNWGLWRLEDVNGRMTKVPYSARYTGRASSTNRSTWTSFDRANNALERHVERYDGLAFFMSEPFVFIDIDHCMHGSEPDERAQDILHALPDQFVELSQSGTGLHIIMQGKIERSSKNSRTGVELYQTGRFIAMTGNAIRACEPHADPEGLAYVFERYGTQARQIEPHRPPVIPVLKDDRAVLEKAKRNDRFSALFAGHWQGLYTSQSEADFALCLMLSYWCERDPVRVDRLFRSSGLFRDKWLRDSYGKVTAEKACAECRTTIGEYMRKGGDDFARYYTECGDEFFRNTFACPAGRSGEQSEIPEER